MSSNVYDRQAALLISVIPEIAVDSRFALHGGTAINLFVRNMPRLSVDIDLTYVPIEDRETSFKNITQGLQEISSRITKRLPGVKIEHKTNTHKLLVANNAAIIKVEVSQIVRGVLSELEEKPLCEKAQELFDAFCVIKTVPHGQLYGGKVCAGMARQHPRDIFDVKHLLASEGITQAVKEGFLFRLLSSERAIQDVLFPNRLDQRKAMDNEFSGMTEEPFTYEEYEEVRENMIQAVLQSITKEDKAFILGVKNAEPDWSAYPFGDYPSIIWKQHNLQKLKQNNPAKHKERYDALKRKLDEL